MKMKKLWKKLMLLGLIGVLGMFGLTACGSEEDSGASAEADDVDIVIGTVNGSVCLVPLHIAIDNGYFEEEFEKAGVTWRTEEIDLSNLANLAATNKIDACLTLAGNMVPQIDNGLEITFTAGVHTGCTKVYTKADSGIESLADLKGKKIGVPEMGDSSVVAIKRALYDLGIGVSTENMEVEWVVYSLTDLPLALENGAIDAAALHDPVAYNAEQEYGFTKLLDLSTDEKFSDEYCCMSFVTNKLAEENPKAAAAFTRAILKASAFVQANPEEAAKLQIENNQCSGDVETNAKLIESYNYSPSVSIAETTIYNVSSELIRIGDLKADDANVFVDKAFTKLEDVPESYIYNDDGTFTEVNE
jgi:NitT/TauT family transport system substrate-binding protein